MALAECCFDSGGVGAQISVERVDVAAAARVNEAASLFGESASRVVVSTRRDTLAEVLERAAAAGVPARVVGVTGGNLLRIAVGGTLVVDLQVDEAELVWSTAIERSLSKRAA